MSEDTSALDRRNFCLALSILEGQQIAHASGFSVPSEDVQQHEVLEIVAKWMLLSSNGTLEQVLKCTNWFVDITNLFNDMDEEQKEAMSMAVSSFGAALIIHMLDNSYLEFIHKHDYVTLDAMEVLRKFNRGM
jgi:hypothetical protein